MRTFFSASNSSRHWPEPKATESSGFVGDVDRHAGLVLQPLVEAAQVGAAAGQDDALVHDVGRQLGRGASRVFLTASTIALTGSSIASRISSALTVIVLGSPETRSRPLTSAVGSSSSG